jgi:Fe-S-cluster formation regulator IscX/YfhJ
MAGDRPDKLAVLIDADNASAALIREILEEAARFGEVSLRRVYGDFSGTRQKAWAEAAIAHAMQPQHQPAYTTGKNSSDIALVIDAMDLMHTGRFDGFCLVSSDSDFTRLALRLREQGLDVYGFGEAKTPASFVQACTRFIRTENLAPAARVAGAAPSAASGPAPTPAPAPPETPREPPRNAIPKINKALEDLDPDAEGWFNLSPVGTRIYARFPDFDPRTYGHAKMLDLIAATNAFDIDRPVEGGVRIRWKTA